MSRPKIIDVKIEKDRTSGHGQAQPPRLTGNQLGDALREFEALKKLQPAPETSKQPQPKQPTTPKKTP